MPARARKAAASDPVLGDLAKVASTRVAEDSDAVAGVPVRYVASATSTDEVSELLRVAGQHELTVVARGAGTKLDWGGAPQRADLVLDVSSISGVVEHAAGDLVVIVRAGTPVEELQRQLRDADQQLALDLPVAGATVGGTLATNTSGPRRLLYGTARDLLIGVTFVRGDGVVAKAGGKVVKNVAGYDFGKLLTGSFGTLGVITEAVFRLHPVPAARRVVTVSLPDAESAGRAAAAVLGSQLVPTAVELDGADPGEPTVTLTVLLEGVDDGVSGRTRTLLELLPGATAGDEAPEAFGRYPFAPSDIGLKLTCSVSGVAPVLAATSRVAADNDVVLPVRGSAAGVLYAGMTPDTTPETVAAVLDGLRRAVSPYEGSVTVLTAPRAVRAAVDGWGPVPGLDLMRRLKNELDPAHRLSPGRFVGNI